VRERFGLYLKEREEDELLAFMIDEQRREW
jgi:hypothetical protein